jgi:hypothetical protein
MTKTHTQGTMLLCMLEIKKERDIPSPCNYCKPEIERERDAPHLLPFVVGFAIKIMHTHKQQEQ